MRDAPFRVGARLLFGGCWFSALCCCVFSGPAGADVVEVPRTKPVNLRVLPGDLSGAKLGKLVEAVHEGSRRRVQSHVTRRTGDTQARLRIGPDVLAKQAARVMITMLNDINGKVQPKLVAYRSEVARTKGYEPANFLTPRRRAIRTRSSRLPSRTSKASSTRARTRTTRAR